MTMVLADMSLQKGRVSSCKTTIKKQCHSERSEESLVHKLGVTEILRYAMHDKMIGNFYYDTPSYNINTNKLV